MEGIMIKGYRIRSGKAGKDICVLTEQDAANYVVEHYQSGQNDEILIKPIEEGQDIYGRNT